MNYKINITFLLLIILPSAFYGQRFAVISDIHGQTLSTAAVANLVKNWIPEFIITAGDNHYAYGSNLDDQVGQYYHDFIYPYNGIYGQGDTINRFFPALGNHDVENGGIVNYLSFFGLPGNERYYDFVKGNIHFFCMNSNPDEPDGVADTSIQALWLMNGLANSTSLYNLVYFHHPPFSSGIPHGSTAYMQWPFKQWGATAVFSGNDHIYERLIVNNMLYFICGTGGGGLYSVSPIYGSVFYDVSDHGAMLVEADSDSIILKFINTNDSLIDYYTIPSLQTRIEEGNSGDDLMNIHIYPNPAQKNIYLEIMNPTLPVEIILYDIFGRMILKRNADVNYVANAIYMDISVSELKNGLYVLYIENDKSNFCKKIIINN